MEAAVQRGESREALAAGSVRRELATFLHQQMVLHTKMLARKLLGPYENPS